jgi:hypothetical protein
MGDKSYLNALAARAAQGDPAAAARLRRELAGQLVYIVRRALRGGTGSPLLDAWILAEVRRAPAGRGSRREDREVLIRRVARELSRRVLGRLRRRRGAAGAQADRSTVRGP